MFLFSPQASDTNSLLMAVLPSLAGGILLGFWLARRKRQSASEPSPDTGAAPLIAPSQSPLIAGLSHEIRTPLNGIAGMTNFLVHSDLDEGQHECVQTIQSCVDALLALVNDILDFSKLEAGRLQMECIEFDLRATLEDVLDVFAIQAQSRRVTLLLDLPESECLRFRGDPHRVRQVVLNFISNGIKFTPAGGEVTLSVSLAESGENTARVRLSVADTGIGIPSDKMDRLFQAFQQADASTTREDGGTGLGLAISRGIAERLGGEVGADSAENEGATFWFELELERIPEEMDASLVDFDQARVLIADPNQKARELLGRQLRAWNVDVLFADSVEGARAFFGDSSVRLVFFDAELLGSEFSEQQVAQGKPIPAFCLVGDKGGENERSEEFSQSLFKPLKQARVLKVLQGVLDDEFVAEEAVEGALPSRVEDDGAGFLEETHFRRLVRILVVDDNPLNRKVAEKMLQRLGYQAQMAVNGREAVEAVSRSPFDLILMDRQMPEMDGLEATRLIRESENGGRRTPIVALTADALDSAREDCLDAGMDDFLVKPVAGEQLAAVVTRWVNCAEV